MLKSGKMRTDICYCIKDLRKERGYSQAVLAELLDVDKDTVGAWERGVQNPGSDKLLELARVLRVSMNRLYGMKNEDGFDCEYGMELRPDFKQEANLDIEKLNGLGLSDVMEDKSMTCEKLAQKLDVTVRTVFNWQKKGLPYLKVYQKLFTELELDPDTFCKLRSLR